MSYGFGTTSLHALGLDDVCTEPSQLCTTYTASFIKGEDSQIAKATEIQKNLELKRKQYQQILEKQQLRRASILADQELQIDAAYDSSFFNVCSEMERRVREQEAVKVQDFNVLLARDKKIKMKTDKIINEANNLTHMYNVLTSDMLLECSDNALSALGGGRLRRGMFKSLPEVELSNIRAFQLKQIADKEDRKKDEMLMDERYDYLQAMDFHEFAAEKRQFDKDKRFIALNVQRDNLRLAEEQKTAQKEMNRQARDNIPTEEFFKQFGSAFRKKQM